MNEIVNMFLLVGNKFMPEMHLKQPVLLIVLVVHLTKIKKELKSLYKLEIHIWTIEMNLIKLIFNMIWLMAKQNI